jgi:hypothetical protein
MSWDATGSRDATSHYPAPPPQRVFVVTQAQLVTSLLISIGMLGFGILLAWGGHPFGFMLGLFGAVGIGQAALGSRRPRQLVLAADGFEWTSPWRRAPVHRIWQECGPFLLSEGPRQSARIEYRTGQVGGTPWPIGATTGPSQATFWRSQATWPNMPMPTHGKRESIGAKYADIAPNELVDLMNGYRNWALQQAR